MSLRAEIRTSEYTCTIVTKIEAFKEMFNDFLAFYDKNNTLLAMALKKNIVIIEQEKEN